MKVKRTYRRRGTPDLPIATYIGKAGENMKIPREADYHPETEIALQVAGTTIGLIGGERVEFKAGDIWIIPGGIVHQRLGFSDDAVVHRIIFSAEAITMQPGHFFQKEFVLPLSEERLEMPRLLRPGHPCYEAVRQPMLELENCRIYEKNYKQHRLSVLMRICLAIMPYCQVKEEIQPMADPGHEGVKLCMRYIHNHYAEKITLEAVAEYCHLHPSYLCAAFKQYTGQSVFDYLAKIRVETAAGLLLQEDLPVSKVAELAGFHSECFFYKKFKAFLGMTPKAYQKAHRNK
ncbi:MAG: helix-turn-helix domain-containing protein [Oscillospiraceae bacterium]|nr:helix-turn-helix domain-containing protein [Oscillospiraceae bacterium]